ncbi:hypothetical protein SBADM41S_00776 [Streptomyces badius]
MLMNRNAPQRRYQCCGPVALYTSARGQARLSDMAAPQSTAVKFTGSPQRPSENAPSRGCQSPRSRRSSIGTVTSRYAT